MASVVFVDWDGNVQKVDPIQDFSMHPPYWMVKSTDGVREFIHFNNVRSAKVIGEDELIKAARAHVGDPEGLAKKLGLEE